MRFHPRSLIVVALVGWVLGDSLPCRAGILADYSFDTGVASSDDNANSFAHNFGLHFGATRSSHGGNIYVATIATGDTEALALADNAPYCTFTVDANEGMMLNLSSLDFDFGYYRATGYGTIENWVYVQSSVDGLGTSGTVIDSFLTSDSIAPYTPLDPFTISLVDAKFQGLSSITFRFSFSDDRSELAQFVSDCLDNVVLNGMAIPEPSSLLLACLGLAAVGLIRRKRQR